MGKKVTYESGWESVYRQRSNIKIQNDISFADINIPAPEIDVFQDRVSFYDSQARMIHLGIYGIIDRLKPESEEELLMGVKYVREHEEQHCRSTASRPYNIGIRRGCEAVLEYISSQVEKTTRRFRTEKEYENFANNILPGMGIYVNWKMLSELISGIANSLEDGRIERIRAYRFPGFEKLRIFFRGRDWDTDDHFEPYSAISGNPAEILRIITNQILSLATCQLFEKGFAMAYAGTPIHDQVNALMPYIAKGVMAGRTRDMADQVVEISRRLAPLFYAACRYSEADVKARQIMEEMIKNMIKTMVDNMPETGLSEQDEDTDEGSVGSTFPHSDLVITLDDETYDKLVKNGKAGKNGEGIMIRREHPKPEEGQENEKQKEAGSQAAAGDTEKSQNQAASQSSQGGSGSDSQDRQNGEGSASGESQGSTRQDAEQEKGNASQGSSGSEPQEQDAQNSPDSAGGASPQNDENQDGGNSGSNSSPDKGDGTDTAQDGQETAGGADGDGNKEDSSQSAENPAAASKIAGNPSGGGQQKKGKASDPNADADITAIKEAMKAAAEEAREAAKKDIRNVNEASAHERAIVQKAKEVPDKAKPITAEDVRKVCPRFKELKREYKLKDPLPAVLAAKGKSLLRKNQQYFKSLSRPNISFLDSGSVDPSRIYGLSFGDTEIFRKKGMDKKFDGCAYILIDNSGSMSGNKRIEACKAAALIEESFRGLIPIKIVAFDYTGVVIHEVVKGWDEQMRLNCCWNFCLHGREGGGNADGYDIKIATMELLSRPERKKLLIVLSDGMPTGTSEGFTKGAINEARKKGCQVTGIYFEEGRLGRDSSKFKQMYQKDYIICTAEELTDQLSAEMKKFSRS